MHSEVCKLRAIFVSLQTCPQWPNIYQFDMFVKKHLLRILEYWDIEGILINKNPNIFKECQLI